MLKDNNLHNNQVKKFIFNSLKQFKLLIVGQLIIACFWALDLSFRPYILKVMIDTIPTIPAEKIVAALLHPMVLYIGMSLIIVIVFRIYDFIWIKFNAPLKKAIGENLIDLMMEHSLVVFHHHLAGNLTNKIKDVMQGVPDLVKVIIDGFISHFIALVIAVFTVLTISYKFSILLLSWVIIFTFGCIFFSKTARKLCRYAADLKSINVGQIIDLLSNIVSINLFTAKQHENKRIAQYFHDSMIAEQQRDWYFLLISGFQGLSFVVYQIIVFIFLLSDFKKGAVTPGDLTLLISINISMITCLWSLSADLLTFSQLIGEITQGLQIVLSPADLVDAPQAKDLIITHGQIVFSAVKFHYPGVAPVFQNNSVVIHGGSKVGIVGYSGGGKSTFINLILRLYDIVKGEILIDGQNISAVTKHSLRKNIAVLPQDPGLFNRSLIENIRYGAIDSSDNEIIEAAKKAHAHEFIMKLPEGYNTLVGEKGIKLSGGQRQRIGIARAILKNAPILILDEATSQLDTVTELEIQKSLWLLMQGKTTIVVAHRLSTLLSMDHILVFDKGRIIETGNHSELLQRQGFYKLLWDSQIGGFLPDNIN